MTRCTMLRWLTGLGASRALFGQCATVRLDQKTYQATQAPSHKGLVFLHTGDIDSTGSAPGFKPFDIHVIVGRWRAPFLGVRGTLLEPHREALLKGRTDLWRTRLRVTQPSGETITFTPPGLSAIRLTVRKVVPVAGGVDHVLVDFC